MSDITFVNNLGTITLTRFMLAVNDVWDWNGRRVKHSKQITVDAYVAQTESESLSAILTQSRTPTGAMGSLTLPWTTLSNIKLTNITYPESDWIDYTRVSLTFTDEYPEGQTYQITWFGYTLINPRITMNIPSMVLHDEYTQMPVSTLYFNFGGVGAGVLRTLAGPGMIELTVSGTMTMPVTGPPGDMFNTLVQRAGVGLYVSLSNYVPAGYPGPFTMAAACPELAANLPLAHLIFAGGSVAWDVENGQAEITVNLITQPQLINAT